MEVKTIIDGHGDSYTIYIEENEEEIEGCEDSDDPYYENDYLYYINRCKF